jgi:hypothetical protein
MSKIPTKQHSATPPWTHVLTAVWCCYSYAGDGLSRLLAGSVGTLLFLPLPRPLTGIWTTWRNLQLAQIICSGSNPRLGCGTLHMARNKTRVSPQAQDTPYHLVTQAVACSKQAHIKAQAEILRTKETAHTCKATVWRWRWNVQQTVDMPAVCSVEREPLLLTVFAMNSDW